MSLRNKLGQFVKGLIPWNKGKKDFRPSPETEFKSGPDHTGEKHPSWKGGEQKMTKDCTHVWDGTGKRKRRPRAVWEEHHGTLPKGMVIYHKDGNKDNDHIDNLEAITRAELLKRNLNQNKDECT